MSVFHVDAEQVSYAAAAAEQSSAAIRAEVAAMMGLLRGLEGSWAGAAATSFQGVIEQWQLTQVQVEEALVAISAQLHQAAQTYADAEFLASSLFQG